MATRGFIALGSIIDGGPARIREYEMAEGEVFKAGDVVYLDGDTGLAKVLPDDGSVTHIGVCAADAEWGKPEFTTSLTSDPSSAAYNFVKVYDDPTNTLFRAELRIAEEDGILEAKMMADSPKRLAGASSENGQSGAYIQAADSGNGVYAARLLGLVVSTDPAMSSSWGGLVANVYCVFVPS